MQKTLLKPSMINRELSKLDDVYTKLDSFNFEIKSAFEFWHELPDRFFFFNWNSQTYCGQKLISTSMLDLGSPALFCSQIKAEMILGPLLHTRTSEMGVEIYYQEVPFRDKVNIFQELADNPMTDLYFPYLSLRCKDHKERTSPLTGWKANLQQQFFLFQTEVEQRKLSVELIKKDGILSPVVYDPACSTGDFLYTIKTEIPDATVIGQDLSEEMCLLAKKKIERVVHGDSISPCVPKNYCDYIFFRFLNTKVVSYEQAKKLFEAIIPCLKKNGKAILFGYTPVLIPLPYMRQKGFKIHACNAAILEKQAIIQYYVIENVAPDERYDSSI